MALAAAVVLLLALLSVALCGDAGGGQAGGPVDCDDYMSGDIDGDVRVTGGTCTLHNANITGSVFISEGGNLAMSGKSSVKGGAGIVGASPGWVSIKGRAKLTKIDIFNSSWIVVSGASFSGEFKVEKTLGGVTICGSNVADVAEFSRVRGDVRVARDWWAVKKWFGCSRSKFGRDIKMNDGVGNVLFAGARMFDSEFSVKKQAGSVTLKNVDVHKIKLEAVEGRVLVQDITADEAELKENGGGVGLWSNEWGKVNCMGNWPGVEGEGNNAESAEGQCEGLK